MKREPEPIITWADVATLTGQIEKDLTCHVKISLVPCPAHYTTKTFTVVVRLDPVASDRQERRAVTAQGYFPQRRWRTATGCIVGLLYDVMGRLEEKDEELRSRRPVRLPGF